jgi:hypothetical protein
MNFVKFILLFFTLFCSTKAMGLSQVNIVFESSTCTQKEDQLSFNETAARVCKILGQNLVNGGGVFGWGVFESYKCNDFTEKKPLRWQLNISQKQNELSLSLQHINKSNSKEYATMSLNASKWSRLLDDADSELVAAHLLSQLPVFGNVNTKKPVQNALNKISKKYQKEFDNAKLWTPLFFTFDDDTSEFNLSNQANPKATKLISPLAEAKSLLQKFQNSAIKTMNSRANKTKSFETDLNLLSSCESWAYSVPFMGPLRNPSVSNKMTVYSLAELPFRSKIIGAQLGLQAQTKTFLYSLSLRQSTQQYAWSSGVPLPNRKLSIENFILKLKLSSAFAGIGSFWGQSNLGNFSAAVGVQQAKQTLLISGYDWIDEKNFYSPLLAVFFRQAFVFSWGQFVLESQATASIGSNDTLALGRLLLGPELNVTANWFWFVRAFAEGTLLNKIEHTLLKPFNQKMKLAQLYGTDFGAQLGVVWQN